MSYEPLCIKINSVVFSCRRRREKKERKGNGRKGTKNHASVIFHLFVVSPRERIFTKFCESGDMPDVITCANFGLEKLRGLGYTDSPILGSPTEMAGHPYNSAALPRSLWCITEQYENIVPVYYDMYAFMFNVATRCWSWRWTHWPASSRALPSSQSSVISLTHSTSRSKTSLKLVGLHGSLSSASKLCPLFLPKRHTLSFVHIVVKCWSIWTEHHSFTVTLTRHLQ